MANRLLAWSSVHSAVLFAIAIAVKRTDLLPLFSIAFRTKLYPFFTVVTIYDCTKAIDDQSVKLKPISISDILFEGKSPN